MVDMKFQAIKNLDPTPPTLNRLPHPLWMSPNSIRMIDKQSYLRRNPRHNCNVARGLTKAVRRSLLVESWRRAKESATDIRACLDPAAGETDPRGAYAILKRW